MNLGDEKCFVGLLPPNVNGKHTRGIFRIVIKDIKFLESKFNSIDLKILFWGQKPLEAFPIRYESSTRISSPPAAKYEIKTNLTLFKSYLKNCEPISIHLHTTKTNLNIGKVLVPISNKFYNFNEQLPEHCQIAYHKIKSTKGQHLGDMTIQIVLQLNQCKIPMLLPKTTGTAELNLQKPLQVHHIELQKKEKPVVMTIKAKEINRVDHKQNIIAYLRGDHMTANSEQEILNEICTISPAQSLVNLLEAQQKAQPIVAIEQPSKPGLPKFIDSIKVTVKRLELTKAGVKEVLAQFPSLNSGVCGLDFIIEAKTFASTSGKSRFISTPGAGSVINFNQTTVQRISSSGPITFKVYFRESQDCCSLKLKKLGDAKIQINEAINSSFSCYKKCPVLLENILIGHMIVLLELGTRGLHFGEELCDAILYNKENETMNDSIGICSRVTAQGPRINFQEVNPWGRFTPSCCRPTMSTCCYETNCCKNPSGNPSNTAPQNTAESGTTQVSATTTRAENHAASETNDRPSNQVGVQQKNDDEFRLLHGLLYINCIRNVKPLLDGGYFIVCKGFWSADATSTEMCQNDIFNFLKTFPVFCNEQFLDRVRNNHLVLELWQKTQSSPEQLVGVARLPLHQFYIAYRDVAVAARLRETCKLPVISSDGWSNVVSPLSSELCGQVNALLAIGTEEQLEFLKTSRALTRSVAPSPVVPVPRLIAPQNGASKMADLLRTLNGGVSTEAPVAADMLTSFIENLAQNLPNRSKMPAAPLNCGVMTNGISTDGGVPPQIKRTADLLENLQKALAVQKPPTPTPVTPTVAPVQQLPTSMPSRESLLRDFQMSTQDPAICPEEETFKAIVDVEAATHLPKVNANKKYSKARNKAKQQKLEMDPCAYVTFEATAAEGETANLFKSHEGMVYATNVIDKDCNPVWKKRFEVSLSVDLMRNPEKRFILKVWRKSQVDQLIPTPMEDAIVGFAAINLDVLLTGMTPLSGWFNIVDFSGRCNGQLQVHIRPVDDVTKFRFPQQSPTLDTMIPLSIDIDGDLSLSRALKRKFIELEEITQRLKARLFDVTGDDDVDPDDEFERDLNTVAMEDEDIEAVASTSSAASNTDFAWLGPHKDPFHVESEKFQEVLMQSFQRSSQKPFTETSLPSERVVSGCSSNRDLTDNLDHLLRTNDIDSLINPNLFKNLLDPTASSSSDTSSLLQKTLPAIPSSSSESSLCATSTRSKESIQFIETALQNAAISQQQQAMETETGRSSAAADGESN